MRLPSNWWMGLPVLAGLVYAATNALTPVIEADLSRRIVAALEREAGSVGGAKVEVAGRDARLAGAALSPEGKDRALAAARRIEGLRALEDATAAIAAARPFVLSFERRGAAVVLSGNLPLSGEREKLVALLEGSGLRVDDRTAPATGAPAGFLELARFAARRVAELDPGQARLTDTAIEVAGAALGPAEYDSALAAAKAPPAAAGAVAARIEPPRISPYLWSAAGGGEMVTLAGYLPSNDLRSAILAKAAAAGAGAAVSDAQRIASGAPEGDFAAALAFALTELGKLTQGKVSFDGARLTIEGQGRENVDAASIEADAKAGLPRGFELARVEVAPGSVSPYVFSAKKGEDSLELEGFAPDAAMKLQILEAARRVYSHAGIADRLRAAPGAPKNFAAAAVAAVRAVARLRTGKAALAGVEATLEGEALHERAIPDIEQRFAAALPAGFKGSARLRAGAVGSSLGAAECRAALNDIASRGGLAFDPDGETLADDSATALDALAATVLRCQDHRIEIAAHAAPGGIEEVVRAGATRRARALVDWLVRAGADPSRLTASGYGGGGAHIEFLVQ